MTTTADPLAEKEFVLIQEISKSPTRTQRALSESIGLSLGMTNLLIKRLARKGLIKVTHLDWKRTQYLLTLKGMMEKTRKTYNYTLYTLRLFRQIEDNITTVLRREYDAGRREFTIVAQNEILVLIQETIEEQNLPGARFTCLRRFDEAPPHADLVLTATPEQTPRSNGRKYLSLVDFDNISFRLS